MKIKKYRALALSNGVVTCKEFELVGVGDDMAILVGSGILFTWCSRKVLSNPDFTWCVVELISATYDHENGEYMPQNSRFLNPSDELRFSHFQTERMPEWHKYFASYVPYQ